MPIIQRGGQWVDTGESGSRQTYAGDGPSARESRGASELSRYEPELDILAPETNGTKEMGVAILAALSIAGLHSAINPSYFTLRSFASRPEARRQAVEGLLIGLGVSTLASAALWFVFHKWTPVILSQATAIALTGIGLYAIYSPTTGMPEIANQ